MDLPEDDCYADGATETVKFRIDTGGKIDGSISWDALSDYYGAAPYTNASMIQAFKENHRDIRALARHRRQEGFDPQLGSEDVRRHIESFKR